MMVPLQKLFVALNAFALLTCTSMARSDDVLKIPLGFAKTIKIPGTDEKGKFTAIIGKPEIADFTYGPKNTFMFIGKNQGTTDLPLNFHPVTTRVSAFDTPSGAV